MKNQFYPIVMILALVFWACTDGQERMYKTPQEVLHENKLLDSFSENEIQFVPETYTEKTVDTTLSNGKRIVIKTYTDMENGVMEVSSTNSSIKKYFYRDLKAIVSIKNNDGSIDVKIDKTLLKEKDTYCEDLKEFYNERIIKSISLSQYETLESNKTALLVDLCEPLSSLCIQFYIIIDDNGEVKIIETKKQ